MTEEDALYGKRFGAFKRLGFPIAARKCIDARKHGLGAGADGAAQKPDFAGFDQEQTAENVTLLVGKVTRTTPWISGGFSAATKHDARLKH